MTTCSGLYHLNYHMDIFTPLREPMGRRNSPARATRRPSVSLEGDDSAGAKTGEAEAPRVLGFEQTWARRLQRVEKFPAPGEVVHRAQRGRLTATSPPSSPSSCRLTSRSPSTARLRHRRRTSSQRGPARAPAGVDRGPVEGACPSRPLPAPATRPSRSCSSPGSPCSAASGSARSRRGCCRPMRVLDHQRHGGRRRDLPLGAGERGRARYEEGRRLYTEEINAAVRGAFAGGASEVVVMDCHGAGGGWTFNSLIPEQLDPRCEFVVQTSGRSTPSSSSRAATRRSSSACTRWRAPSAA